MTIDDIIIGFAAMFFYVAIRLLRRAPGLRWEEFKIAGGEFAVTALAIGGGAAILSAKLAGCG